MDETEVRITLRLPTSLRHRLARASVANNRSMNGEIVARLDWSFAAHPYAHLIRGLVELQEDLLTNTLELVLDDSVISELRLIAERRGMSVEGVVSKLIEGAIRNLDEKTALGEQIERVILATVADDRVRRQIDERRSRIDSEIASTANADNVKNDAPAKRKE